MMAWDDASELRNAALGKEISLRALTERERKVRRDFWTKFKRFAGQVPFAEDIVAGYYSALDPATPIRVRAMLLAAIAYFILPLDLIPDRARLCRRCGADHCRACARLLPHHVYPSRGRRTSARPRSCPEEPSSRVRAGA